MFVESNFSFLRLNLGTNIYQDNLIGEELIKVDQFTRSFI